MAFECRKGSTLLIWMFLIFIVIFGFQLRSFSPNANCPTSLHGAKQNAPLLTLNSDEPDSETPDTAVQTSSTITTTTTTTTLLTTVRKEPFRTKLESRSFESGSESISFKTDSDAPRPKVTLFISFGSKPLASDLRNAHRETWLTWIREHNLSVAYRFFTELNSAQPSSSDPETDLTMEDVVGMPVVQTGYRAFGDRFVFQLKWALDHYNFDYFLKLDDDSFACLPRIMYDLETMPREQFFWGKYFCQANKGIVADENFMLFSRDVVEFLYFGITNRFLKFHGEGTFAAHFGFWQHFMNLTILDDQSRIDAQQLLLTSYMHRRGPKADLTPSEAQNFCFQFVYAHHVYEPKIIRRVFEHTLPWRSTIENFRKLPPPPLEFNAICKIPSLVVHETTPQPSFTASSTTSSTSSSSSSSSEGDGFAGLARRTRHIAKLIHSKKQPLMGTSNTSLQGLSFPTLYADDKYTFVYNGTTPKVNAIK